MQLVITFGQDHRHVIDGVVFDRNCVGLIECNNFAEGRQIAFSTFGTAFCTTHVRNGSYWKEQFIKDFYPRGYITAPTKE